MNHLFLLLPSVLVQALCSHSLRVLVALTLNTADKGGMTIHNAALCLRYSPVNTGRHLEKDLLSKTSLASSR